MDWSLDGACLAGIVSGIPSQGKIPHPSVLKVNLLRKHAVKLKIIFIG
jgi:hypothetical protein